MGNLSEQEDQIPREKLTAGKGNIASSEGVSKRKRPV